ncbi:MAG: hypothetical protein K0S10_3194 [Rubrobacteraceae bacterium]|jgi:hypothetical protein|nr:hypothetical protein [Rubrobacteraceae bacterium]
MNQAEPLSTKLMLGDTRDFAYHAVCERRLW